jgi:hypothetical protein
VESGFAQNNTNNIMSNTTYDILFSDKNPDAVLERLNEMVSSNKQVCVRLEQTISPFTLWGILIRKDSGRFLVESSDRQSFVDFNLNHVTSIGKTCIWITP